MKDWEIIYIKECNDPERGVLYVAEYGEQIPFVVQRIYFMKSMPSDATRGGQTHKSLQQVLIPVCGSFDVELKAGDRAEVVRMDYPQCGLYIAPRVQRTLLNFSEDAVCLVLASEKYDAEDIVK